MPTSAPAAVDEAPGGQAGQAYQPYATPLPYPTAAAGAGGSTAGSGAARGTTPPTGGNLDATILPAAAPTTTSMPATPVLSAQAGRASNYGKSAGIPPAIPTDGDALNFSGEAGVVSGTWSLYGSTDNAVPQAAPGTHNWTSPSARDAETAGLAVRQGVPLTVIFEVSLALLGLVLAVGAVLSRRAKGDVG